MRPLEGDPASCSQAGGSLRRLASQLRSAQAGVARAGTDAEAAGWSGRVARGVGRTRQGLEGAALATADELDRAGALLQEHSTDLAEALQSLRTVSARAEAAGLEVADGQVVAAWGVSGIADEALDQARDTRRAELQAELDRSVLQLQRRRARLTASLDAARHTLAAHSGTLRS